jgi:hypothetical protein
MIMVTQDNLPQKERAMGRNRAENDVANDMAGIDDVNNLPVDQSETGQRLPDEYLQQQVQSTQDASVVEEAIAMGIDDRNTSSSRVFGQVREQMASGKPVAGGDIDAMSEQAKVVGEEAVGGTTPTPDQNEVDDITDSVGVSFDPDEPVKVADEMRDRDRQRWELDPDSGDRPSRI